MNTPVKKPGRPKSPQPRKIPRMVSLSIEATEYLNSEAIRTNRSPSNVVETVLLNEKKLFEHLAGEWPKDTAE